MKIAICLSGQPRHLTLGYEMINKFIIQPNAEYNIDFFIHTWYDEEDVDKLFNSAQYTISNNIGVLLKDSDIIIKDLYKPKKFLIEPQKNFDKYVKNTEASDNAKQNSLCSLFYSMYISNNLKRDYEDQNNFSYDLVLRTRTDLIYYSPIIFNNYINNLNSINIPKKYFMDQEAYNNKDKPIPDIFAFSNTKNMNIFCSVYPEFLRLNKILEPKYGENYLGHLVRNENNIEINPIDFELNIIHRIM
jgi:hypothetical protein